MIERLLPRQIDNTYRGHKLALWLFGLLVLMKVAIGLNSIFNGHLVASSADGIPLDSFTPDGTRTVVSLFAIWGLSQLLGGLVCILVLVRYRSMISFLFALLLLEHGCRRLILHFLPVPRTGTPPGSVVNLVFLVLMIGGLALSLRWKTDASAAVAR